MVVLSLNNATLCPTRHSQNAEKVSTALTSSTLMCRLTLSLVQAKVAVNNCRSASHLFLKTFKIAQEMGKGCQMNPDGEVLVTDPPGLALPALLRKKDTELRLPVAMDQSNGSCH